jgi:hypothetical protein
MIKGTVIGIGDKAVAKKFQGNEGFKRLKEEMEDLGDFLVNYVVTKKLSGQVLGAKGQGEGRLRRSMDKQVSGSGKRIKLIVGTPFSFYIVHEKGATIQGRPFMIFSLRRSPGLIFARTVKIPKRPFMEPTLRENRDLIRRRLGKAFVGAIS